MRINTKPQEDPAADVLRKVMSGRTEYPFGLRIASNRARALPALDRLRDALQRLHPSASFHPVFPPDEKLRTVDVRALTDDLVLFLLEACGDVCPLTGDLVAHGHAGAAAYETATSHFVSCAPHARLFAGLVRSFLLTVELSGEGDGFIVYYADALGEFREACDEAKETKNAKEESECGPYRVPLRCRDENGDPHVVYVVVESVMDVKAIQYDCNVLDRDFEKIRNYADHLTRYAKSLGCDVLDSVLLEGARQYYYLLHNLPLAPPNSGSSQKT